MVNFKLFGRNRFWYPPTPNTGDLIRHTPGYPYHIDHGNRSPPSDSASGRLESMSLTVESRFSDLFCVQEYTVNSSGPILLYLPTLTHCRFNIDHFYLLRSTRITGDRSEQGPMVKTKTYGYIFL